MEAMDRRWDERFTAAEQRWDERFTATEQRWDERITSGEQQWDQRLATAKAEMEAMEHRLQSGFERGIREAVTSQTRALVVSQLFVIVAITGLAFGLGG